MKGNTDIPQGSPAEAPLNPEPAKLQLAEYVSFRAPRFNAVERFVGRISSRKLVT